jgi:hypothetical protein
MFEKESILQFLFTVFIPGSGFILVRSAPAERAGSTIVSSLQPGSMRESKDLLITAWRRRRWDFFC